MAHMNYTRVGRRWRRVKGGFRLNSTRFYAFRLRSRLFRFIGVLTQCLISLKKGIAGVGAEGGRGCGRSSSRRGLVHGQEKYGQQEYKLRYCRRSNSFYAEAIADCLEFIKRSSASVDDISAAARR